MQVDDGEVTSVRRTLPSVETAMTVLALGGQSVLMNKVRAGANTTRLFRALGVISGVRRMNPDAVPAVPVLLRPTPAMGPLLDAPRPTDGVVGTTSSSTEQDPPALLPSAYDPPQGTDRGSGGPAHDALRCPRSVGCSDRRDG